MSETPKIKSKLFLFKGRWTSSGLDKIGTCLLRYETSYHCPWFIMHLRRGKKHKANKKSSFFLYTANLQLLLD